jgi:hypothetical protein
MKRSLTILLIFEVTLLSATAQPPKAIDIGSRRELFVDDALIDRLVGKAELRLHHPVSQKVVLKHDEPWEGSGSVYHSIFKDGDRFRMYYAAGQLTVTSNGVDAGRVYQGKIINQTETTLTIAADPKRPSSVVQIPLEDVEEMVPSKVSMMPNDLLNTLTQEDILDLLAFIESGGNAAHPNFVKQEPATK